MIYEVLTEEYAHLRGEGGKSAAPIWAPDTFEGQHIRDLSALVRSLLKEDLLKEELPKKILLLGEDLPEEVREPLKKYKEAGFPPAGSEASNLRKELAKHINELLGKPLPSAGQFIAQIPKDPPPPQYSEFLVHDIKPEDLERASTKELRWRNWLVLEQSFPGQIVRIRDLELQKLYQGARKEGYSALCLSGGGIRSATFALGLVQAFAEQNLLEKFNYLSTVSGGGYLGGWLSAWSHRVGFAQVVDQLKAAPQAAPQAALDPEKVPIRHLRSYSNYLSPRAGMLSADTWTLVATYLRNLLLNWLVLVPTMAAVICVPYLMVSVFWRAPLAWASKASVWWLAVGLIVVCTAVSLWQGVRAFKFTFEEWPSSRSRQDEWVSGEAQKTFVLKCLVPLVACVVLTTAAWSWVNMGKEGLAKWVMILGCAGFGAVLAFLGWRLGKRPLSECLIATAVGFILGGVSCLGLSQVEAFSFWAANWLSSDEKILVPRIFTILAPSLLLGLILLGGYLSVGFVKSYTDSDREWAARFSAWLLIAMCTWLLTSGLVLIGPLLVQKGWYAFAGTGGIAGLVTILLGSHSRSPAPEAGGGKGQKGMDALKAALWRWPLLLAAPLFAAFLVILLSRLDDQIIQRVQGLYESCGVPWLKDHVDSKLFGTNPHAPSMWVIFVLGILGLAGWVLGRIIDTNRFSLHGLYRERLIRAYLGASRPAGERRPDPFTGFDEKDDLAMHALSAGRVDKVRKQPLHVINMALNLVGGVNLAWQQRKACSFTVSPFHAGAYTLGYRPVKEYGGGIKLGTAMTISGAAANPNMGYNSSPAVTFLMTLFNARLGCWLGNPGPAGQGKRKKVSFLKKVLSSMRRKGDMPPYGEASPKSSLRSIFAEMLGLTSDTNPYVQLSDGGHFENLGLYEMVLRRCRFIVVSDATCDGDFTFADLGNAIRKIRVDLGVPIEFDDSFSIGPRTQDAQRSGGEYWAFARIRYSVVDMPSAQGSAGDYDGILVYVKPALYGKEPRDVLHYSKVNEAFPHESTADQFFSESQFESYRSLGFFIGERLCKSLEQLLKGPGQPPENTKAPAPWVTDLLRKSPALDPSQ